MHRGDGIGGRRPWRSKGQSEYHPVRWLLLSGRRIHVTVLFLVFILALLLVMGTLWEFEMERLVNETRAVQSMFNTLLGGIILFVSVVLSINVAALSQEFDTLQAKQDQIEESLGLRSRLESFMNARISPTDIEGFFEFVLLALRSEMETLRDRAATNEDPTTRGELTDYTTDLEEQIELVEQRLRAHDGRLSTTLLAGLEWDAIHHVYEARRIELEHRKTLNRPERDSLSNVMEMLVAFAAGREYFTTVYYKRELRNLSHSLVILSLPVIVFTAYVLLAIDAGLFPDVTAFGIDRRLLYVSIAFVISLSPYVMLTAYILRIVTVSRHSLPSGGFTHPATRQG